VTDPDRLQEEIKMSQFKKLFEPGKIGTLSIKNRYVMPSMGNSTPDDEGYVTEKTIEHYVERAMGNFGLIVVQFTSVMANARGSQHHMSLYDDKFIPKLRALPVAVKKYGARIALQLAHAGSPSRLMRLAGFKEGDQVLVSSSAVPNLVSGIVPKELSKSEIRELVDAFAQATWRAREAGFDAVEINGAHGKLLNQFLSPYYNRRTDEYGGSLENRARFGCELLDAMRRKVGSEFPLLMRMNARDGFEGGLEIGEAVKVAQMYVEAGAQALDISAGDDEGKQWTFLTHLQQPGGLVNLAEAIKKAVKVPVIATGRLGDPVLAERILEEGKADFIALGRPSLCDPYLPLKVQEGRLQDIDVCITCGNCTALTGAPPERRKGRLPCIYNPGLARALRMGIQPAPKAKSVMVIGGGPAGMEAAKVAALRGHKVTLYEKADELGGQWNIVCQEDRKEHFMAFAEHQKKGLKEAGVSIVLNQEVTPELVKQQKPDVIILAAGASPAKLKVPGIDGKNVVQAVDVICNRAIVGDRVVVIGGRYIGLEVAVSLARQNKKVSICEMFEIGHDGNRATMGALKEELIEYGVHLYPNSKVVEIRDNGVMVVNLDSVFFLKADTVVLAVGTIPEKGLMDKLGSLVSEVHAIGDCLQPQDALAAVSQGAEVGCKI
jgi:2,4-dienoyl-CoA reductase-like NADH-dependent reductase (Old Yellow Enzyme family)/thioredoxin reductase